MTIDLHKLRKDLLKDCKHPQLLDEALLNLKPFFERLQKGVIALPKAETMDASELKKLLSWCRGAKIEKISLISNACPLDLKHIPRDAHERMTQELWYAMYDRIPDENMGNILHHDKLPLDPPTFHDLFDLDEPWLETEMRLITEAVEFLEIQCEKSLSEIEDADFRSELTSQLICDLKEYLLFARQGDAGHVRHFREYATRLGTIFPLGDEEDVCYLLVA